MSKQARRKSKKIKERARQTLPALLERGTTAFNQADYGAAIQSWEKAYRKPNAPAELKPSLAEAYFRQALTSRLGPLHKVDDLEAAIDLSPADPRFRYHLALTHHQQGRLGEAEAIYRHLLTTFFDSDESASINSLPGRVATALAQLLIEQKKAVQKDAVWKQVPLETQKPLAVMEALLTKKASSTLARLAEDSDDALSQGLIAYAEGDKATGQQQLQQVAETLNDDQTILRGLIHYYLGQLVAEQGDLEAAIQHWRKTAASNLSAPSFQRNMAMAVYHHALALLKAGQPEKAAATLPLATGGTAYNKRIMELQQQLHWEVGYRAAQQNDWKTALQHWTQISQQSPVDRKLLLNLALAYQKTEAFLPAADHWRQLLRRRPRKADHPDALNNDQVARIWQNVADNYSQAGDFEEAIKTYKNAVKWAPENVDLRLKLVDAYQTDGRWQAAENELNRILEKEPDHIQALTLLAESYADDYFPDRAKKIWLRILELEPQNPIAKQQLAHLFASHGLDMARWGNNKGALATFKEGLTVLPDSPQLHICCGVVYIQQNKLKQAHKAFEQALALAPEDLKTLYAIHNTWLEFGSEADFGPIFERLTQITSSVPSGLFLDLIEQSLEFGEDAHAARIIDFMKTRYADDLDALVKVASIYDRLDQEKEAVALLRQVLDKNENHAEANLRLGGIYYETGQKRLGKRLWDVAEAQATKEDNHALLYELQVMRDYLVHGKRPPSNPLDMIRNMPPEAMESFLKTMPPEIAAMIRDMGPEMLEVMMGMAGMGFDDDDDFDDDLDDFFGDLGPRRK